ncbi:MAG: hypothetical protein ABS980_10590, partial [Rhodococcus sp. (in: high G+C Gram-positive bacteria)]
QKFSTVELETLLASGRAPSNSDGGPMVTSFVLDTLSLIVSGVVTFYVGSHIERRRRNEP